MRRGIFSASLAVIVICSVGPTQAASPLCPHYGGHIDVEGKLGSQRDIGETSVFIPVACSEDMLLFSDLRFKADNQENREANLGLGIRSLQETGVVGGYAYFDRKKSGITDKYHSQMTLGAEWLAEEWEVRANGYVPLTGDAEVGVANAGLSSPFLQGSGIFARETAQRILRETPLYGGDIEAGFKIPDTKFWLHAAAFSFAGDDAPSLDGTRARATFQLTDNVALTAEGQYDDERGRQGWIGVRLTIPFGGPAQIPQGPATRMTASPVRDIDIVTQTQNVATSGADRVVPVLNTATGVVQQVVYIDNSLAVNGNGTMETPYNNLNDAQAALTAHSVLYIASGTGNTTNMQDGLTLTQTGVQVIGAGSNFIYDGGKFTAGTGDNFSGTILKAAGTAPLISNTAGNGLTITGNNITVTGLHIDSSDGNGILVRNAENIYLNNLTTTGNNERGLFAEATGAANVSLRLDNVVVTGNLLQGIEFDDESTGSIQADLGGGALGSVGGNHIFGNISHEISADFDGGSLSALANWWGGGALADITGADAGSINSGSVLSGTTCISCTVQSFSFTNNISAGANREITSNNVVLGGFTGSRYITANGAGTPELVVNNVATGDSVTRISSGDTVAIRLTSAPNLAQGRSANLTAGQNASSFTATTENFLATLGGLTLWMDANDLDGDFDYADNPANGTSITHWYDKSGMGDTAIKPGFDPDPIRFLAAEIGGQGALEFDGVVTGPAQQNNSMSFQTLHNRLILDSGMNSGFTVFQIANWDAFATINYSGILGTNSVGNHIAAGTYAFGGNNTGLIVKMNTDVVTGAGNQTGGGPQVPLNQDILLTYDVYSNGTNNIGYNRWINGAASGASVVATTNPITANYAPNTNIVIGARASGNDNYADVTFSEIIVFDRVLNATERGQVEDYLSAKYNIP